MGRRSMVAFATAFLVVLAAGGAAAGMFAGDGSSWPAGDLFDVPRIIVEEPTTSMATTTSPTSEHDAPEGSEPAPGTTEPERTDPEKTEATTATTAAPVDGGTEEDTTGKDLEDEPADTEPPDLVILHPENGATVKTGEIAFEGVTEPGARVFAGPYEADVDDEGRWRIVLRLEPGGNLARFVAKDAAGNMSEASVKVVLETEKARDHAFTAHQKYGPGSAEPYEKLYGTGTPGTVVHAVSPYGSGSTTVDAAGNWWIKLHFEGLTPGDDLRIVVEADTGERAEFGFVLLDKDHTFTAHQKYGSCGEDIPYDVFYGTGVPGATVWVESPYGGGTTTVGSDGRWDLRVEFPEAPRDMPFEVVVESDGGRQVLGFVATGGSGEHG